MQINEMIEQKKYPSKSLILKSFITFPSWSVWWRLIED